jgi:hypothetical protein
MTSSPLASLSLLVSALSVLAIIAGGIVLFVVGKGRGALPGTGFLVLGVGTAITTVFSFLLPSISAQFNLGSEAASGIFNVVVLLFSLVGWGLVLAALLKLRNEKPDTGGQAPPYGPGPGYGPPPYGPGAPGYGPRPGEPLADPPPGPPRQDPYGPGWGQPPGGTQGPPPPPGV